MKLAARYSIVLVSTWLLLAAVPAFAKPIEDRKWIRMESPNFTVQSMLSKRRTKQLVEHLDTGLDSEATSARAAMGMGILLEMQGDSISAEERIMAAADMLPENYELQLDAAFFYLDRYLGGDLSAGDSIQRDVARAALIDDESAEFNFLNGMFLRSKERFEESARALEIAALKAPADHTRRLYLIDVNAKPGRFGESRRYAQELLAYPHLPPAITTYLFEIFDESGAHE